MRRWMIVVMAAFLGLFALHFTEELNRMAGPPSPTWSRSVAVGQTNLNTTPAGVDLGPAGYLVGWSSTTGTRFALLRRDGQPRHQGDFPTTSEATEVVAPRNGRPLLFWRQAGQVAGALLDPVTGRPTARYTLAGGNPSALAADGRWLAVARPDFVELYRLNPQGPVRQATVPVPGVESLSATATPSGGLRLFLARRDLTGTERFWEVAVSSTQTGMVEPVSRGSLNTFGESIDAIRLGFDQKNLYYLVVSETYRPRATSMRLAVEPLSDPALPGSAKELPWRLLRPTGLVAGGTEFLAADLGPSGGSRLELAGVVALSNRLGASFQAFSASLSPAGPKSFAMASRATGAVLQPILLGQGAERLLCYTESTSFQHYRLSVTGTGASFRVHNRLTRADLAGALAATFLDAFSFFVALYYVPATVFPALAVATVLYWVALTWSEHHSLGVTLAAFAAYLAGKLSLLPYTFYEDSVRELLPSWLAPPPVGWAFALLFFCLGVWAALAVRRGRPRFSPYTAVAILGAVDLYLTLFLFTPYLR